MKISKKKPVINKLRYFYRYGVHSLQILWLPIIMVSIIARRIIAINCWEYVQLASIPVYEDHVQCKLDIGELLGKILNYQVM